MFINKHLCWYVDLSIHDYFLETSFLFPYSKKCLYITDNITIKVLVDFLKMKISTFKVCPSVRQLGPFR